MTTFILPDEKIFVSLQREIDKMMMT